MLGVLGGMRGRGSRSAEGVLIVFREPERKRDRRVRVKETFCDGTGVSRIRRQKEYRFVGRGAERSRTGSWVEVDPSGNFSDTGLILINLQSSPGFPGGSTNTESSFTTTLNVQACRPEVVESPVLRLKSNWCHGQTSTLSSAMSSISACSNEAAKCGHSDSIAKSSLGCDGKEKRMIEV